MNMNMNAPKSSFESMEDDGNFFRGVQINPLPLTEDRQGEIWDLLTFKLTKILREKEDV